MELKQSWMVREKCKWFLGAVRHRVPAVDGGDENVRLAEKVGHRLHGLPGLLALPVPGGVEEKEGALVIRRILKSIFYFHLGLLV